MLMLKSTHRALMAEQMIDCLNKQQQKDIYYNNEISQLQKSLDQVITPDDIIHVIMFIRSSCTNPQTGMIETPSDVLIDDIINQLGVLIETKTTYDVKVFFEKAYKDLL